MKALIVVLITLALIYLVSQIAQEPVTNVTPSNNRQLEVVSFLCGKGGPKYSAEITVRNLTSEQVSSPEVFVQFNPKGRLPFEDSVKISPSQLAANATGHASLISRDNDVRSYDCSLRRILDSSGARVD